MPLYGEVSLAYKYHITSCLACAKLQYDLLFNIMVEYTASLDTVFASLAHPTRRDILWRLQNSRELTVSEVAAPYSMSLAAVSKHLNLLRKAHLIMKRVQGKTHYVSLEPATMQQAMSYLQQYETTWNQRLDRLQQVMRDD